MTPEGVIQAEFTNITMTGFARVLRDLAPGYIDRAVVDQTGLKGGWNIKLNYPPNRSPTTAEA